jgi:hypothetical protein
MQSGNVVLRSGLILEIKCHDPDRVYIRLYLFYHPEHLPGGRQTFHGRRELMATNHMVVMDAANIVRQANIKHWNEGLGQALPDGLYWRQEFDIPTGTLSVSPCWSMRVTCTLTCLLASLWLLFLLQPTSKPRE